MKDNLILQDKNYISAKRAAIIFGYTSDYFGQLCRSGKLECKMIGRSWFVTEESLIKHREEVNSDHTSKKVEVEHVPVSSPVMSVVASPIIFPVITDRALMVLPQPVFVFAPAPTVARVVAQSVAQVNFAPYAFALPQVLSESFLFAPSFAVQGSNVAKDNISKLFVKYSFATGVLMIAFVFAFQTINFSNIGFMNPASATVLSASQDVLENVLSLFTSLPKLAMNIIKPDSILNKNNSVDKVESPPPEKNLNGLVVVPSSNSKAQDEIIKQRIRNTFSDEVQVSPDSSGSAGVITPVFRKAKSDDFVYVMVPISNQIKN